MTALKKYLWLAAAVALLGLPSCLDGDPIRTRYSSLGLIRHEGQDTTRWWFMSDDSVSFVAQNRTDYTPKANARAVATMELLDDQTREGYDYVVNFLSLDGIKTYPVMSVDSATIDTATNDEVWVSRANISLQYLNISIELDGYNGPLHEFMLLRDSTKTAEPISLMLRHNANGDAKYERLSGIISFDLETLAERSTQDSVKIELKTPKNGSEVYTYKFKK